MPRKQRSNRSSGGRRPPVAAKRIKGYGDTGYLTATSAVGTLVVNTFELDTTMFPIWDYLAKVFQKWRIRKLGFQVFSNVPVDVQGAIGFGVCDDPDAGVPTTIDEIVSNRVSYAAHCGGHHPMIYWSPIKSTQWLFTNDQLTSDDRFEMPGNLYVGTWGFNASSGSSFRIRVYYDVEFDGLTNPTLAAAKQLIEKPVSCPETELNRSELTHLDDHTNESESKSGQRQGQLTAQQIRALKILGELLPTIV